MSSTVTSSYPRLAMRVIAASSMLRRVRRRLSSRRPHSGFTLSSTRCKHTPGASLPAMQVPVGLVAVGRPRGTRHIPAMRQGRRSVLHGLRRTGPLVDAAVDGPLVDGGELLVAERRGAGGIEVGVELRHGAGADQCRGHLGA